MTYTYECEACQHLFDTQQSMNDAPLKKCPECNKMKLVKIITGIGGIKLKGTGFHDTDYNKYGRKEPKKEPKKE